MLDNRAVKDDIPKVFIDDKEINCVDVLSYLGLLFLTHNQDDHQGKERQ